MSSREERQRMPGSPCRESLRLDISENISESISEAVASMSRAERQHFESIRQWIHEYTGLHYPERKYSLLYQRLKKLCWRLGLLSLQELNRHLLAKDLPDLPMEVTCAVSTNHTYFFRERKTLAFFRTKIIPQLPVGEQGRIWSAAASGGDEAYTLAIILAETLGLRRAQAGTAILGTDIDRRAIEQAEQGVYDESRLERVPERLRQQYFRSEESNQWRIQTDLQQMCTFRRLNLMKTPWPFQKPFHVVLCRNVLYYFDRCDRRDLVERLYDVTTPGGWLLTSVTESLQRIGTRWRFVTSGVYRRVN